jgi:hypothetical protein
MAKPKIFVSHGSLAPPYAEAPLLLSPATHAPGDERRAVTAAGVVD